MVVPARNEEAMIEGCIAALAAQKGVEHDEYEILLVLDACDDGTELAARRAAAHNRALRLRILDGPGRGAGHARRVGMDAACARLLSLGRPDGLVASTDADTTVAPDWLATQVDAARRGARAIGGNIQLRDDGLVSEELLAWHAERGRARLERLLASRQTKGTTEHWHFAGASLALTAATYESVGGIGRLAALEDEHLEQVLVRSGVPIDRLSSVSVTTSARTRGRASRGLAYDLARAEEALARTAR